MRDWKLRHWLLGAGLLVALLTVALFFYYSTVQRPLWDLKKQAVRTALKETPLERAERTELSHSEQAYVIVYGVDAESEAIIVWVSGEGDTHYAYTGNGTDEAQILEKWRSAHPDGELIRIVPSVLRDEYAWEIYYEKKEPRGVRKYYDYYRFEDGEWLNTYTLTLQR